MSDADGILYRGSCTSDHSFSSSDSHAQVRSMNFLYDHIDPAKSAAKDRKAAEVKVAEKAAKKREEAREAVEELLDRQMEAGAFFDTTA